MNRRRGIIQIVLGIAQIMSAAVAAVVVVRSGVNDLSIAAALIALLALAASRLSFTKSK